MTQRDWINVKDRLPEMNQRCLVWVFGAFTKTAMYKGKWPINSPGKGGDAWLADDLDHWASDDVSHWMPEPAGPELLES